MNCPSLAILSSALIFTACGPGDDGPIDGEIDCAAALLPGDLVITEVMANPEGDDDGNEYFEIYNATTEPIDLTGLVLGKSAVDGSKAKRHVMVETIIEPGAYMALGGVLPEFRAPYIGYGYADDLGGMTNSGGNLSLSCGDVEVDLITYAEATSGHSQGLDGNITPNHISNDTIGNFCDATTEFATDSFGSPGVANEPCSIVEQTTCLDGGTEREVVQPSVGDLVVTEVMPNPDVVGDEVGEWFEVVATGSFDLNGVVAGTDPADPKVNIVDENCLSVSPGDRLLFARGTDPTSNGGLPAPDFTFSFGLTNGGSTVFVGVGETVIDTMSWSGSSAGKSISLDPALESASANDDEANWCDGQAAYGAGDLGTPGAPNTPCDTSGMCMDGATLRPTNPPLAGDVTITEWLPNPDVVSDSDGEWFEVNFAASADLNGLQLGREADPALVVATTIDSVECVTVDADTAVVFARETDTLLNGGLPTAIEIHAINFSLVNSNGTIFVAVDNELLDVVQYTSSTAGSSTKIDPNDMICASTTPYSADNDGTPGEFPNPVCE